MQMMSDMPSRQHPHKKKCGASGWSFRLSWPHFIAAQTADCQMANGTRSQPDVMTMPLWPRFQLNTIH